MPRSSFKRTQPTLSLKPKIIIACEDSKSSRFYLKRIKEVHRLASVQFEILEHEGTDPKTIVGQLATRIRLERKQQAWANDQDEAWAIFDGDEHQTTVGDRENWNAAIQQARDLKIRLGIINPSVEFWYLLHFQPQNTPLSRTEAMRILKQHYPKYDKSLSMYDDLEDLTMDAINRARTLLIQAQNNEIHEHANPCCAGFAELIERLINLK